MPIYCVLVMIASWHYKSINIILMYLQMAQNGSHLWRTLTPLCTSIKPFFLFSPVDIHQVICVVMLYIINIYYLYNSSDSTISYYFKHNFATCSLKLEDFGLSWIIFVWAQIISSFSWNSFWQETRSKLLKTRIGRLFLYFVWQYTRSALVAKIQDRWF